MDRLQRAKQFAPFNALTGLHQAIRIKEFEHESVIKGDLSESQAEEISNVFLQLEQSDVVKVVYFTDGHEREIVGGIKLMLDQNKIKVLETKIDLSSLRSIEIIK